MYDITILLFFRPSQAMLGSSTSSYNEVQLILPYCIASLAAKVTPRLRCCAVLCRVFICMIIEPKQLCGLRHMSVDGPSHLQEVRAGHCGWITAKNRGTRACSIWNCNLPNLPTTCDVCMSYICAYLFMRRKCLQHGFRRLAFGNMCKIAVWIMTFRK